MKLNQAAKTFETNAEFTSQDFTIGDISVVIEILRNKLYRHKVRTLVQEYISNARDATREVNGKRKIEITLPTVFVPTFKVRDFGPGITPERMYNVFIKYASSTKRDSNKQTGGFGIGAKSAWSYTDSFTIVTYVDGVQRSYVAHIGANNNGRLDFLGEVSSTEPNGTEIQIPVSPKDIQDFVKATKRATYFWKEEETPIFTNIREIDKNERAIGQVHGNIEIVADVPDYILPSHVIGIIFSIDGIPYVIDDTLSSKVPSFYKLTEAVTGQMIIHLENGELEVAASREEISDSKHTLDSLDKLGAKTHKTILDYLTTEFKKAKTPFEHLSVYMNLKDKYNLSEYSKCGNFTVNSDNAIESDMFGLVSIERCEILKPSFKLEKRDINKSGRRRRSWSSRRSAIKADWFNDLYYVDGSEPIVITNYRIRTLLATKQTILVFTKAENNTGEFDTLKKDLGLKDLKTIVYTKPDRKAREVIKVARTKKEFVLHRMDRYSHKAVYTSLEKNTIKWLVVEKKEGMNTDAYRELSNYLDGFTVCALGQDAMKRVKGDKNFQLLSDFLKTYKVTDRDIKSLKGEDSKNDIMICNLNKMSGLKDKFLVKMIQEYKDIVKETVPKLLKDVIGKVASVEKFKQDDIKLEAELKTRYPLLDHINWYMNAKVNDDIVTYINAK